MLQGQNIMPLSLSIQDSLGSLGETGLAAQVLQGLEGIQLQLTTGSLGQGIQITGLDPSLLSQTVQIDASLLQQLQQQGNLNLAINPNIFTQTLATADPNLVQNIQIQPAETLNPNVIVQPLLATAGQTIIAREAGVPATTTEVPQEVAGTSYSVVTEQQLQAQVQEHGELVQVEQVVAQALEADKPDSQEAEMEDEQSVIVHEGVSEDNLEQHLQSDISLANDQNQGNVESGDPERTHVCLLCNKAFKRAGHLKEHQLIHAPGIAAQRLKPTPHKCTTCDKSFSKPSQLERHIRIHTGERPFVCNICLKAFNQKNALQIHLKKHSGERPHKCPYCGLAFTQKGNLKTHIKRAHHIEMVQSMNLPKGSNLGSESGLEAHPEEEEEEEEETEEVGEHQEAAPQEGEAIDFEGVVRELFPQ